MLHFAPDFQLLILYILLPSCFDVLFLYSLFFSQGAQGEKLGTHWLPLSKPTFLGLFDKWVSATTPRATTAVAGGASFPDTQLNSVWFCSLSLASIPLLYYQIRVGSKNSIWKKARKSLKCRLEFELFWVTLWRYIRLFFSFHYWIISFFLVMTCFQNFYGNKENK